VPKRTVNIHVINGLPRANPHIVELFLSSAETIPRYPDIMQTLSQMLTYNPVGADAVELTSRGLAISLVPSSQSGTVFDRRAVAANYLILAAKTTVPDAKYVLHETFTFDLVGAPPPLKVGDMRVGINYHSLTGGGYAAGIFDIISQQGDVFYGRSSPRGPGYAAEILPNHGLIRITEMSAQD
jgi:hypothetical protein